MNRLPLLILPLCLFAGATLAQQGFQNCIEVIASAGKSGTQGGLTFHYTVGESVITTLTGDTRTMTQGFHQPDLCIPVSTDDLDLAAWGIEVFPNPAVESVTVRFSEVKGAHLRASVFDLLGRPILSDQILTYPEGSRLDCVSWQPGVYVLQLQDPVTRKFAAIRFVRL